MSQVNSKTYILHEIVLKPFNAIKYLKNSYIEEKTHTKDTLLLVPKKKKKKPFKKGIEKKIRIH